MQTKTILFATISMLFMMFGVGCEEDNQSYQGKVISLNVGACYNIIQIEKSIPKGLPVNSTITFDLKVLDVETGQVIASDIVTSKADKGLLDLKGLGNTLLGSAPSNGQEAYSVALKRLEKEIDNFVSKNFFNSCILLPPIYFFISSSISLDVLYKYTW